METSDEIKSALTVKLTVYVVEFVAVLSFLTGILNINSNSLTGFLGSLIPVYLQQTAGFTGVVTGFLLLIVSLGLRKRLKIMWYLSIILLPLTAFQGLLQSNIISVPLIVLSLISMLMLIHRRSAFEQSSNLTPIQLASVSAFVGVTIYGVVGSLALRSGFNQPLDVIDATYYTLVTISTVGYGDIYPVSAEAKLFVITLVVLGTTSFAAFIGSLVAPLLQSMLGRRFREIEEEIIEEIQEAQED